MISDTNPDNESQVQVEGQVLKSPKGPLHKFGTAKIGGVTCSKKAATVLRIDLAIPHEKIKDVLEELQLESTDEFRTALYDLVRGINLKDQDSSNK